MRVSALFSPVAPRVPFAGVFQKAISLEAQSSSKLLPEPIVLAWVNQGRVFPIPEIAPPPLGLVGPVAVPADPPAALLPKPEFDGAPGLGVVTPVLGAC